MRILILAALLSLAALSAACDKNEPTASAPKVEPPSAAIEAPPAAAPAIPAAVTPDTTTVNAGTTQYIDHDKDEVEFSLKRSLDGAQSRLEDATNPDQIEMIKNDIAEIQAQLDAL